MQAAPTSQKDRPIAFALLEAGAPMGAPLVLPVRPENLTIAEPFRVTPHHTLGGAYVDAFGRGIGSLTLAGTTGWRGGEEAFARVREEFSLWARLREARVKAGLSPDDIELSYVDNLNKRTVTVVPQQFVLQRSRQDPLLLRYHIQCAILDDVSSSVGLVDGILGALNNIGGSLGAVTDSLSAGVGQMTRSAGALSGMAGAVGGLAQHGAAFVRTASGVIQRVTSGIQSAYGFVSQTLRPIYNLAMSVSAAGRNLFAAITQIAGFPAHVAAEINAIIGGFTGFWCSLTNAFAHLGNMFDLSGMFGASNCSSTSGGAPISRFSNSNPFEVLQPATGSLPLQSDESRRLTVATAAMDPLANPLTVEQAADRARRINAGIWLP